jgi:hypothetical protein
MGSTSVLGTGERAEGGPVHHRAAPHQHGAEPDRLSGRARAGAAPRRSPARRPTAAPCGRTLAPVTASGVKLTWWRGRASRILCPARRGGHRVPPVAGAGPPRQPDDGCRLPRGAEPLPSRLCPLRPRLPGGVTDLDRDLLRAFQRAVAPVQHQSARPLRYSPISPLPSEMSLPSWDKSSPRRSLV